MAQTQANRHFISYRSKSFSSPLIGLLSSPSSDLSYTAGSTVAPCLVGPGSGTVVRDLYDLIEDWDTVVETIRPMEAARERLEHVEILAPLTGRDILAVAKNYRDHVKEMRKASAEEARTTEPELPMMFTKRATSIVPHGGKIYLHPQATQSVDYEGELAIIIGKAGYSIKKEDAFKHVWGATILNDISARDRQKLHKQFYVGKSFDTFCPVGPYAVYSSQIDWTQLMLETRVNGEVRQRQNTSEVIFDIPTLMENCSAGITLQPGDIIATGTPAGVAAGRTPPAWLKHGDVVEVSITGLGTLSNVCDASESPPAVEPVRSRTLSHTSSPHLLTLPNEKSLNVQTTSPSAASPRPHQTILFIHGLGGSIANSAALIEASGIENTHRVIAIDLEGHGLTPLSSTDAVLSVESWAEDVREVLDVAASGEKVTIAGHSMGALVACHFAAKWPQYLDKLFLISPAGPTTLPVSKVLTSRAEDVRKTGLLPIASLLSRAALSKTNRQSPLMRSIVRSSVLSNDPESYARTCLAMARATSRPEYENISARVMIVQGEEDRMAPRKEGADLVLQYVRTAELKMTGGVGHWPHLEALEETAALLRSFLGSGLGDGKVSARL